MHNDTPAAAHGAQITAEALKPCPFCGLAPYTDEESAACFGKRTGHNYAIACTNCEASAPGAATMQDAWANWNERATPRALAGEA